VELSLLEDTLLISRLHPPQVPPPPAAAGEAAAAEEAAAATAAVGRGRGGDSLW